MDAKGTRAAAERMARECIANQLRMLTRVVTGIYESEFRPLRLTVSQMVILVLTARHGRVRAAEIGRVLQMDASTLSRNIERMRVRGWLEEAPKADGRSRPFRLTPAGARTLRDASRAWERAQTQARNLVGEEGAALLRRLTKPVQVDTPPA